MACDFQWTALQQFNLPIISNINGPCVRRLTGVGKANKDNMKKTMLINASQSEENRIAIIEDGRLEELYVERASQENFVGNVYKGKIVNLCLLYTSPSPRDATLSRMPSSA